MADQTAAMPAGRWRPTSAAVASGVPPFGLLLCLAWLLAACQLLVLSWHGTALSLNDTDDAMRLVQMRAFLNGQGWFDLHEPRVHPPLGYDTHWSRLIDAGLGGFVLLFRLFTDSAFAERMTRTVWPLLWLLPTIAAAAVIAWRLASREAALVALLFAAFGFPLFQQFVPGRIDHHNVQIAVALMTLAAVVWSDRLRWTAGLAGTLTGLALNIGLEALPYFAACGAAVTIRYVLDGESVRACRAYGIGLAVSTLAAFLISVPHYRWSAPVCDAIAINLVAGILVGAAILLLACAFASTRVHKRAAWVIAAAIAAVVVVIWLAPECLAGPFAMVKPAVWPIWLSEVSEMQPLARTLHGAPLLALTTLPFVGAAFVAVGVVMADPQSRADFGVMIAAMMLLLATIATLAAVRTLAYALWFALPLVAALALRIWVMLGLATLIPRFTVALLLTPCSFAAAGLATAHGAVMNVGGPSTADRKACFSSTHYESLAQLPTGLVFASVDIGPFLLALTAHSVVATPYHRAADGILLAHNVLVSPPAAARALFDQAGGTYVMTCGPRGPVGLEEPKRTASLWGQLEAGNVPDWLEQVQLGSGQPFKVYRRVVGK